MAKPSTRAERRAAAKQGAPKRASWLLWVGLAVAAIVALLVLANLGQRSPAALSEEGAPKVGGATAPLHVYLFEDYQCPICRHYELDGGADQFNAKWVATGKVLVVYKHLTFLDARSSEHGSTNAALASLCVNHLNQTAWSSWHHLIFQDQGPEGSGWATPAFLRQATAQWGRVDMAAYDACLGGGFDAAAVIARDKADGDRVGVTGTPTLVVKGQPLNALDASAVDTAIQAALGG